MQNEKAEPPQNFFFALHSSFCILHFPGKQSPTYFDVLQHALRGKASPLEKFSPQLCQEGAVHPVPALVIAAQAIQNDLHFVNVGELARVHQQIDILADAQVEGGKPDRGFQPTAQVTLRRRGC